MFLRSRNVLDTERKSSTLTTYGMNTIYTYSYSYVCIYLSRMGVRLILGFGKNLIKTWTCTK